MFFKKRAARVYELRDGVNDLPLKSKIEDLEIAEGKLKVKLVNGNVYELDNEGLELVDNDVSIRNRRVVPYKGVYGKSVIVSDGRTEEGKLDKRIVMLSMSSGVKFITFGR